METAKSLMKLKTQSFLSFISWFICISDAETKSRKLIETDIGKHALFYLQSFFINVILFRKCITSYNFTSYKRKMNPTCSSI